MKHTATVIAQTTTPTGEPGLLIECTCTTHKGNTRAIIRHCDDVITNRIHGLVLAAWHPFVLAGAQSAKKFGPWAA